MYLSIYLCIVRHVVNKWPPHSNSPYVISPTYILNAILYLAIVLDFDVRRIACHMLFLMQSSREEKLAKRRMCERARRADETAEEKETRLSKRRARDRARRAQLCSQKRQDMLQHMRVRQQQRRGH